jgi:hypothetical protein
MTMAGDVNIALVSGRDPAKCSVEMMLGTDADLAESRYAETSTGRNFRWQISACTTWLFEALVWEIKKRTKRNRGCTKAFAGSAPPGTTHCPARAQDASASRTRSTGKQSDISESDIYKTFLGRPSRDPLPMAQAPTQSNRILEPVADYGTDVITLVTVENQTAVFESGPTEPPGSPGSGRPPETRRIEAVRALVGAGGQFSQKKIVQTLSSHYPTVKCIFHNDLNMRNALFEWVLCNSKCRGGCSIGWKAVQAEVCFQYTFETRS